MKNRFIALSLALLSISSPRAAHGSMGALIPAALGFLFLPGCAEMKSSGDECYEVDFVPSASGATRREAFESIHEACRLGLLTDWDLVFDGPILPSECEEAILDFLPLDTSFRTGTVGAAIQARSNLAKAFHALLYFPLADTGDIFGSSDAADYCPATYLDFLGAQPGSEVPSITLADESDDSSANFGRLNLHLARFFIERTGKIRFIQGNGTYYAKEKDGDILITASFADLNTPLTMAAVLVHETRHNADGFPDGSDHVECVRGEAAGSEECDDWMFGSYGAHLSYLDAALKGSIRTTLWDGTPILDELQAKSAIALACTLYQNAINSKEGRLADLFTGEDCGLLASDVDAFFERAYGLPAGSALLR